MTDLNKCHESKTPGNIITAKGKLFFAKNLFTPKKNQQGKLKYQLELCIPGTSDLVLLKNKLGKLALEHCDGNEKMAKGHVDKRILDPNNKPNNGKPAGEEFEGWSLIRASSDVSPDIISPSGKKLSSEDFENEVYSGRWARASIQPYWFNNSMNPGVFLGLVNVQLLDHDDPIGFVKPSGTEEFSVVEETSDNVEPADALFS